MQAFARLVWDFLRIASRWARGALALLFILALVLWLNARRQVSMQKSDGHAAVASADFLGLSDYVDPPSQPDTGFAGGVPGGIVAREYGSAKVRSAQLAAPAYNKAHSESPDRKIVRHGGIRAVVNDPRREADAIAARAQELGGYVASLKHSAAGYGMKTELRLRVPAPQFEELRRFVLGLAREIKHDQVVADDVTKRYADLELNIRNYKAEEEQYLVIMRRAVRISDVLEVTEKLSYVRARIEDAEAALKSLKHDIEMSALAVELEPEQAQQIAGIRWKPAAAIKAAFYDAGENLGDFAATLVSLLFNLPVILLWAVLVVALLALGWKMLKLVVRLFAPGLLKRQDAHPAA